VARVLTLVALLAFPAAAGAQAPGERAAARAFADAGLRLAAFIDGAEQQFDAPLSRCARRQLRRLADERAADGYELAAMRQAGEAARLLAQPLLAFSRELHGVQTADPALRGGRTAWRRIRRAFQALEPFAGMDLCAELRRYVAAGFRRTPAVRRARRAFRRYDRRIAGSARRMDRAIERLQELGVPRAEARAFDGEADGR
jgi:hypothetical protein